MQAGRARSITAATIGNVLEWYDWGVYGLLASAFAAQFFPSKVPVVSLLLAFATFAVGFLLRPVGAFFLGPYGDRHGRRKALALTIILMGIGSLVMGVVPSFAQIGILAPVILLVARLLQGFSTGGEFGGSVSYMVEFAAPGHRGYTGGWQQFTVGCGTLLASLVSFLVTRIVPAAQMDVWGWRIPFLLGVLIAAYGAYLRLRIAESPEFEAVEKRGEVVRAPVVEAARSNLSGMGLIIGIMVLGTLGFYTWIVYLPTYVHAVLKLPLSLALSANTVALVIYVILIPFVGILSDRVGRRPVLLVAAFGFVVLTYPFFLLLQTQAAWAVYLVQILALVLFAMTTPGVVVMAELMPTRLRYSGMGVPYAIAVAAFGGTAPLVATFLISALHSNLAVAYYAIAAALVTGLVVLRLPETFRWNLETAQPEAGAAGPGVTVSPSA